MRFGVLGPLVVWDGEGREVRVPEAKVRALLADLLAHDGGPVTADRLIHDLWGDAPPGKPAGALQAKISQLRRVVGRDRLVRQPAGYRLRLDGGGDEVDAVRFRALVTEARPVRDPRARAALLTEALELWRGPAYADFADGLFVRGPAQRLAEQRLSVLEEQAEARLEAGDHALLAGELADLVAVHPLRERLRAAQMRALYAAGRQSEALASYEDLRTRLVGELGVDPSPELAALHGAVLRQEPGLSTGAWAYGAPAGGTEGSANPVSARDTAPGTQGTAPAAQGSAPGTQGSAPAAQGSAPAVRDSAPSAQDTAPAAQGSAPAARGSAPAAHTTGAPPATPPSPPSHSNLPVPLTPLVGRRQALADLSQLLAEARLVTLTGPGGVGKTRLAVAAATAERDGARAGELADGTWLVEFSGIRAGTPADLAQVVAATLGIRDDAPHSLPGTGTGTPSLPHRLAAALRDRRTLLVLDNCEHVVDAAAELTELLLRTAPGLRVLATGQEPLGLAGEAMFLVEPLEPADAVRMFMERAAAAAPGFPRDPDAPEAPERRAVAEICRRLDGIPLALELAATRVRALGVRELAERLNDRFRVLTFGQRGAPARQQTLRAVIDWSWELLSAPERIVLRRLAAHSDGCDLAAAEAVCTGDGVARDEVLDLVTRLVDRSLVVVVGGPSGPRYRLLESVAAYATERLHEMEDLTAVRDRHLRHYRALAEHAEPRLRGAGQRDRLARLDAEAGNLRSALDEAVRRAGAGEPEEAVRLATALAWWWLLRGRLTEARRSLGAVLAATVGAPGSGASAPAPGSGASTPAATPAAPSPGCAELALLHAAFALLTGDHTAAAMTTDGPARTATADAIPDPVRRARALWLCAYGLFSAGDTAGSGELNARALALFTAAEDRWGTAAALGLRATLALVRGDLAGLGRDGLRSALIFRELGDRWGELQTVSPLAALAEIKGAYEDAERRQHEGLRMARELGLEAEVSARLSGLGRLALLARDWDRARDLHEQARRIAAEQGYKYGEIHSGMGLALGARRSGDLDRAEAYLLHIRDGYAEVSSQAGDHLLLAELGFVAELRGDARGAASHHLAGLEIARALAEPRALALSLEGLAGAVALPGRATAAAGAAVLLGAAAAARRRAGAPLPPAERADVDRITVAARAAMGADAFSEAYARGARLDPEEALRQARTALPAFSER
ncbi:BTAD domain-containing putative transcriptional regulator [Streptomyces sp. BE282]|uniref:AfsR/SARP family transcriptional regulator n=1 Tax=unclassified Streptomyces TaxID=2593676 RepID=UPI001A9861F9|nr:MULTISPECIES: BTAD domain-containing putative transcriptional regulator [unclassified Streptomyces]MEE1732413.1 BTAD domain-containing putative transcriptional regulator [Streptomyces sp. BE282]MEE1732516.1 BTAD domain-containing putative transcriptional regulator [Streptomyces sp. BE282]QTA33058.1 Bacterial transcriptional activator domain protein [Streptomyces sp. CA-256286]